MYKLVPVFVPHLGCPFDCVFCNQRAISGFTKPVEPLEIEQFLQKIFDENGIIDEVAFYGGSFTAICESLQDKLLDVALKFTNNIRISTRPDAISDDILKRLKQKKVKIIELGVQSMCDDVLMSSQRGHTASDTINACQKIKKHGFILGIQMMIGMPCDTYEKLMYTTNKICDLKPDLIRIYPIVVIQDTQLFDMYKQGTYKPLELDNAVKLSADVLQIFNEKNINVIRVGLNPTDDLTSAKAIAGAYHPAFGQMVESEIYYRKMLKLIEKSKENKIIFGVYKSEISTAVGQKRINIQRLYNEYNKQVKIKQADIKKGDIILL